MSDEEVVDCMRKIDGEALITKQWSVDPIGPMISSVFRPTVDGKFIAKPPDELLRAGNFQKKDILIGAVCNEGSIFLPYLFASLFPVTKPRIELSEDVYRSVIRNMSLLKASNDFVVNSVAFEYARPCYDEDGTGWTSDYTAALDKLLGDALFTCPVVNFARNFATNVRWLCVCYYVNVRFLDVRCNRCERKRILACFKILMAILLKTVIMHCIC